MKQSLLDVQPMSELANVAAQASIKSRPVCIAGMHRSGTSMVARLLNVCGLYLGPENELPATGQDNPQGHWENIHFAKLNEALLSRLGGGWDLPPMMPALGGLRADLLPLQQNARAVIEKFSLHALWGWKDPRNSLTLPFWQQLLPDLKVIICLRHPLEVAHSLQTRGYSSLAFGLNLWTAYNQQLLATTRPGQRLITPYASYFHNPQAELQRLLDYIGLSAPEALRHQASLSIKSLFRHQRIGEFDLPAGFENSAAVQLYQQMCTEAGPVYQPASGETPGTEPQTSFQAAPSLSNAEQATLQAWRIQAPEQRQMIQDLREIIVEKEQAFQDLSAQVAAQPAEPTPETQSLLEQIAHQEQILQKRDEGIAWLQNELSLAQSESARIHGEIQRLQHSKFWRLGMVYWTLRTLVLRVAWPIFHPIKWLGQQQVYWRWRSRLKQLLLRILPAPVKIFIKSWLRPRWPTNTRSQSLSLTEPSNPRLQADNFYQSLPLRPNLPEALHPAILDHPSAAQRPNGPDILCFSIIDWDFRYQRPQQLMSQFAAHGHRVFYLNVTRFLPATATPKFAVERIKDNVYEVFLSAAYPPDVYREVITGKNLEALLSALDALRQAYHIESAFSYVMKVSWGEAALVARERWGWRLIYDCMDEWENFPGIEAPLNAMEPKVVQACDLLVVTAQRLYDKWKDYQRPTLLVRNAADYDFYASRCQPNNLLGNLPHPVIGYYGAIADWFDLELMTYVAAQRPHYQFVLLGGVFEVDVTPLQALPNVRLLGQQPYETMPQYLYHFDVCLIPFKLNSITAATDPVKFYEYLSEGRPVVSVALPELEAYSDYLYLANDPEHFVTQLDLAVVEADPQLIKRRKALAQQHTWAERYRQIALGLAGFASKVSIVIVTHNNLVFTKLCLESLLRNTAGADYEIIVVDNGSTDGTPAYLRYLAERYQNLSFILNRENLGFAQANNQGLARARGDYLVLLNNDTVVPPHWLGRLLAHLADPHIGLVGPVTNWAGNEAKIEVPYSTWAEMETFAQDYTWSKAGQVADIPMLAMYCVAMRREVYEAVGPLDEQFGLGLFEDDDYTHRVRLKGYRIICALDAFIHHFGQATFTNFVSPYKHGRLFEENRRRYEAKWQTVWTPHRHASLSATPHRSPPPPFVLAAEETAPAEADYVRQLDQENRKWGDHLKVEASGEWHAWLDHPLILAHYQHRALVDGVRWEEWVKRHWGGPACRSLDLGCGAGSRSLSVWEAGASSRIEGMDVSADRIAEGERRRQALEAPGRFEVRDINTLRLPENTYDLIFSCHSFHHFLKLEHILQQVSQALTERGLFILEEFTGPTQFQWTDRQMQLTSEQLRSLPPALRTFRWGQVKKAEARPLPEQVMAASPFESIRSAEIWPLFQQHFEIVAVRKLGGTIQHLLYNGIIHNFRLEDKHSADHLRTIYEAEDRLIDSGELPSDFMLLIGRKK